MKLAWLLLYPEGPSTQYLKTLIPTAIKGMVFGTRVLKHWVLGPSGVGHGRLCQVWTEGQGLD